MESPVRLCGNHRSYGALCLSALLVVAMEWLKGTVGFEHLANDQREIIGAVCDNSPVFSCFIGGARAGEYTTLDLAKEKLLEKCRKKKLL